MEDPGIDDEILDMKNSFGGKRLSHPLIMFDMIGQCSGRVLLNGVFYVLLWLVSIIGSLLHDLTGRRKVFIFTTASLSIAMVALSICSSRYEATHSKGSSSASLFFIYAFGALFTDGVNTMFPIYPAEVPSNILRSKSTIVFNVTAPLFQLTNQLGTPKALEKLATRSTFSLHFLIFSNLQ